MTSHRSRLSLFAALVFSSVGFIVTLVDALRTNAMGLLAPAPWVFLVAVLVLVPVIAGLAPRARQEGAFSLSGKSWRRISYGGGALAGVWAAFAVYSFFTEGNCDGGICSLFIIFAPLAFVLAFAAAALVLAAGLGALALLKGLPFPASLLVLVASAGLAGSLPTLGSIAVRALEDWTSPSHWYTKRPRVFPDWGMPAARQGGPALHSGEWQHTLTLGRPGLTTAEAPTAMAISADGRVLVIAAGSRLHRWDVSSGEEQPHAPLDGPARALALSHDGGLVAYAQSGRLLLRELGERGASQPKVLADEEDSFEAVAFSQDGSLLVGATATGALVAFRPGDAKPLWTRPAFSAPTSIALAVSADGEAVFVSASERFELLWLDGDDGDLVARHPLGELQPPSLAVISRDGRSIRGLTRDGVIEWTPSEDEGPPTLWPFPSDCLALETLLSPDGERLLRWCGDMLVLSWVDKAELQRVHAPTSSKSGPPAVSAVGPGARWAVIRGALVDLNASSVTGEVALGIGHTAEITSIAATPEGTVTTAADGTLRVWTPMGNERAVVQELGEAGDLRVHTAGEVVARLKDGLAQVLLRSEVVVKRVFQTPPELLNPTIALSPDGSRAVISGALDASTWETLVVSASGELLSRSKGSRGVLVLDGGLLVSFDGVQVVALDPSTKQARWTRQLATPGDPRWVNEVTDVRSSPDGKELWVTRSLSAPTRLASNTGEPLGELPFPLPAASAPDGSAHVTLSEGAAEIRDGTGAVKDRLDFALLGDRPTAAAFAANGRELWIGTGRGQVFRFARAD
ncbi:hypothetical protein F0U61_12790 [Archangium violaceum]|uniref:WD40 repeat domain-containing protein n=1 Tax=Archangium violaceum TaxID=83451 RepID=UPI002B2C6189|nr:hypothetical protein F0U61_12790 [Archangium violaceum]